MRALVRTNQLLLLSSIFFVVGLFILPQPAREGLAGAAVPPSSFADLAEQVKPAVVNISTTRLVQGGPFTSPFREGDPFREFFERFFGGRPQREFRQRSLGSGFIIEKEGLILTNNHVIEGAEKIQVILANKERFDAKVVGRDAKTDIAVIRIDAKTSLPSVSLGDSAKLKVGDWVIAVGNPFGLGHTITAGIVSAKGRIIGAGPYDNFIQTDAAINPGNSGGPLFNLKGEVVGINTAIVSSGQGIGFAIPINLAKEIIKQLEKKGRVVRGWLGVTIQEVTPALARRFGLKRDEGTLVSGVIPDSPAARAGIQTGDVIIEFDGTRVKEMSELPRIVASTPVGKRVIVKVIRAGRESSIRVKIGELPEEKRASATPQEQDLGMAVSPITPELARRYELTETRGIVVTGVAPGSSADEAGISPGNVILELDRQPVNTLAEYEKILKQAADKDSVLLLIKTRRGNRFAMVKMEKK